MARGVLFIGGAGPDTRYLNRILSADDLIAAADSGLDACLAAGIRPQGVVGDMDSLSDRSLLDAFHPDSVEIHPEDKDDTDAELGIAWLRRQGARNIVLIGGGEGRLDHTLALMALFRQAGAPGTWYTAREEIRLLADTAESGEAGGSDDWRFSGSPGDAVSFFAVGSGPWNMASEGLRWELDGVDWARGGGSLSNRFTENRLGLRIRRGRFLMIRPIAEALAAGRD